MQNNFLVRAGLFDYKHVASPLSTTNSPIMEPFSWTLSLINIFLVLFNILPSHDQIYLILLTKQDNFSMLQLLIIFKLLGGSFTMSKGLFLLLFHFNLHQSYSTITPSFQVCIVFMLN